jgi:hypothetical protein
MSENKLKRLRRATDDAIGAVEMSGLQIHGAVNWADLHCLQAAWVSTDDGYSYAEVTIEEASPDAVEFQHAVEMELARRGWPDIHVVTEW